MTLGGRGTDRDRRVRRPVGGPRTPSRRGGAPPPPAPPPPRPAAARHLAPLPARAYARSARARRRSPCTLESTMGISSEVQARITLAHCIEPPAPAAYRFILEHGAETA